MSRSASGRPLGTPSILRDLFGRTLVAAAIATALVAASIAADLPGRGDPSHADGHATLVGEPSAHVGSVVTRGR